MKTKKIIALTASVALCAGIGVGALASGVAQKIEAELRPDFTIIIDGEERTFKDVDGNKVEPVLYDGTTYLPVRAIGEMMGKTVYWYEDSKTVELKDTDSTVTDADVIVNGSSSGKHHSDTHHDSIEETSSDIGLDKAKAIALEKAGFSEDEVTFKKAKLDYEDGVRVYEIEYVKDDTEYSADINAETGDIVSWEVDEDDHDSVEETSSDIGLDKAKAIALDNAGFSEDEVTFKKAKLDYEDGVKVYEIEYIKDGMEYSADINAETGNIVSWEVDDD